MVDASRLAALLDRMSEELQELHRLANRSPQELAEDTVALPAAKYRLVVAIEAAIDAGEHIIASEGLRASLSYADVFAVLAEAGWLKPGLAAALQDAARFRNLLVHGYARVDDRRVVEALRRRLSDLEAFRVGIARRALDAEGS